MTHGYKLKILNSKKKAIIISKSRKPYTIMLGESSVNKIKTIIE